MRFQCLGCGKPFGWTAKKIVAKIIEGYDLPVTMEYVVCPYCESFDYEEYRNGAPPKKQVQKSDPSVRMPSPANFDPEELMKHPWKGKKVARGQWEKGSNAYGWDFKDQFSKATITELMIQGTVCIDKYEFQLSGSLVSAKKAKQQ